MREDMSSFASVYLHSSSERSAEENWESIKSSLKSTIDKNVPTRTSKGNQQHPWISASIWRKAHKKHRLYRKAIKKKDHESYAAFKSFKRSVEKEVKQARSDYINKQVLDGLEKGNSKPFYKYIKSLKNDNTGLAPLKSGSTLITSPQQKADLLLEEFSSAFTQKDTTSIPWLGPAKKVIDDICVTTNGVKKLLQAPVITSLFNQSLASGSVPQDWSNALITPVFKKETFTSPQTIALSL